MFTLFEHLSLSTERLIISPFQEHDLEAVYDMHAVDDVNQYIPYRTWKGWDDAEKWLAMMRQRRVDQEAQIFTIKDKSNDSFVGTTLVFSADKSPEDLNFGYVVAKKNWGKGYASEAMEGLVSSLLSISEIPLLNATVQEGNIASMRLLVKLNFDEIGRDVEDDGTRIRMFKRFST